MLKHAPEFKVTHIGKSLRIVAVTEKYYVYQVILKMTMHIFEAVFQTLVAG